MKSSNNFNHFHNSISIVGRISISKYRICKKVEEIRNFFEKFAKKLVYFLEKEV